MCKVIPKDNQVTAVQSKPGDSGVCSPGISIDCQYGMLGSWERSRVGPSSSHKETRTCYRDCDDKNSKRARSQWFAPLHSRLFNHFVVLAASTTCAGIPFQEPLSQELLLCIEVAAFPTAVLQQGRGFSSVAASCAQHPSCQTCISFARPDCCTATPCYQCTTTPLLVGSGQAVQLSHSPTVIGTKRHLPY